MAINIERLMENLLKTGEIGRSDRPGGGVDRLAFSPAYFEAAHIYKAMLEEAGLRVTIDRLGNVIGRRAGAEDQLPALAVGSHLDTVRDGGLYDGNLGCHAALECIHALSDAGVSTRHPIEVIGFNAEEGGPMGGTFGSRAMMGKADAIDKNTQAHMPGAGITLDDVRSARRDPEALSCYLELHIEQGAVLEREGLDIGIVSGIVGITRCLIRVQGEANHAGTTPMAHRRDALKAAASLILGMHDCAAHYPEPFVFTVGNLTVFPGMATIIPGEVVMQLEVRDLDQTQIESFLERVAQAAQTVEDARITIERQISKPPVAMDPSIMKTIEKACSETGAAHRIMASGAGHDAMTFAGLGIPTGMIFVPSRGGISHSPAEFTAAAHIEKGAEVLYRTLLQLDAL